jgi:hypothetical protein
MSSVVVVGVSVDFEIPRNELPEQRRPVPEIISPVDDRFVPCRRQRLNLATNLSNRRTKWGGVSDAMPVR